MRRLILIVHFFAEIGIFRKSQPKYKFCCKCHDEQFHGFILLNLKNTQDDMIEKTNPVAKKIDNPVVTTYPVDNPVVKKY